MRTKEKNRLGKLAGSRERGIKSAACHTANVVLIERMLCASFGCVVCLCMMMMMMVSVFSFSSPLSRSGAVCSEFFPNCFLVFLVEFYFSRHTHYMYFFQGKFPTFSELSLSLSLFCCNFRLFLLMGDGGKGEECDEICGDAHLLM